MTDGPPCRICGSETTFIGTRAGRMDGRRYKFCRCSECKFSFVENYRSDLENIYNEDYYRGSGGDPMVDYVYENDNPGRTIRFYEYRGLCQIFSTLCPTGGKWLDFGCGGGFMLKGLPAKEKLGVEINPAARKQAAENGIRAVESIDEVEDGWADLIISDHALEHVRRRHAR